MSWSYHLGFISQVLYFGCWDFLTGLFVLFCQSAVRNLFSYIWSYSSHCHPFWFYPCWLHSLSFIATGKENLIFWPWLFQGVVRRNGDAKFLASLTHTHVLSHAFSVCCSWVIQNRKVCAMRDDWSVGKYQDKADKTMCLRLWRSIDS